MSSGVDVVILAEDKRHRMLLRRYLRKRNYSHRKIYECQWFPNFRTPCLNFVRESYPKEVQALRKKAHRVTSALLVVVDADDLTVNERLQELDQLLQAASQEKRQDSEHIPIVVPRRNIETWMYYLAGNTVDEETDYKLLCRPFDDGEYATLFANLCWPRGQLRPDCPPSLQYASEVELRRLPDV